jgi:hypothetical protein
LPRELVITVKTLDEDVDVVGVVNTVCKLEVLLGEIGFNPLDVALKCN